MSELVFEKRKFSCTIFENGVDGTNDQQLNNNKQAMTVIFSRYLGLILEMN